MTTLGIIWRCGFDGHLIKPIEPSTLDEIVSQTPSNVDAHDWMTG